MNNPREQLTAAESTAPAPDGALQTLHIRCGSDIQATLSEAGFVGDFLMHAYPFCRGPVTRGPDALEQRARFIASAYGKGGTHTFESALADGLEVERRLAESAASYERVVLWVEHDSYDQLMLVNCLAHYAKASRPRVLEKVCIDRFPGVARFIGLGQLSAANLRELWEQRQPVTLTELALGAQAWIALTSNDPRDLAALMRTRTPALPLLAPALHRHLRELPSVENGLSLTEHLTLQMLADHASSTAQFLFRELQYRREPLPWLGDLMYFDILEDLARSTAPALIIARDPGEAWPRYRVTLTDTGRAILKGERDWLSLHPPERWVGGVQIRAVAPGWRWDEARLDATLM